MPRGITAPHKQPLPVLSEALLSLVASYLGGADSGQVGFLHEAGGLLRQQIVPRTEHAGLQACLGYSVRLDYHTEAAVHPHKPAFLLLLPQFRLGHRRVVRRRFDARSRGCPRDGPHGVSFRYDADLMLARTGAAHRALDRLRLVALARPVAASC